tara:strand:+ start:277 stop:678 length:402 start_codon:yes stop_codon:yes gene_type:complete
MASRNLAFSLMEFLLVLALVSAMLAMAVPTWRQHQLVAGRQQGWLELQRLSLQEQMWQLQHGHYFSDIEFMQPALEQLHYRYQIHLTEVVFLLSVTVNMNGPQRHDKLCWQLTLSDTGEVKSLGKEGHIQVCN